jgi:hypothetical protein
MNVEQNIFDGSASTQDNCATITLVHSKSVQFFYMEHSYSIKTWLNHRSPDGLQKEGTLSSTKYGLCELRLHPKRLTHELSLLQTS